ncbi:MAG TPA: DUF1800 family protein [Gaiellales bacterium]
MTAVKKKVVKRLTYHERKHRQHVPPAVATTAVSPLSMTQPMVDRLFWRTGFGPGPLDHGNWVGKPVTDAVDKILSTPGAPLVGAPPTNGGMALDPFGDDTDLVLSWVDQMVRTPNPFVERMTFYWHRHFANSRQTVSPPQLLATQNALFRSYADLSAKPAADFKSMANDVSIDPSMLRYLTGESNVKGAPNENYARELMELFTLGPINDAGTPNYSEADVQSLAKALTGWVINDADPNAVSSAFENDRWYLGPKFALGTFGNWKTPDVVSLVLSQPNHATFLVRKLWGEFIPTPPDAATLTALTSSYVSSGLQLKPLLRQILTHPDLFESIDEPNMLKPPVVYAVGVMRALGRTITDSTVSDYLDAMGQQPYFPPNVSGWEGGLSWLNTNTALARWGFVAKLVTTGTPIPDVPGEVAQAAFDRAYLAVGSPWLAAGTRTQILAAATAMPSKLPTQRLQRQQVLRTLMLAGPDAQVM